MMHFDLQLKFGKLWLIWLIDYLDDLTQSTLVGPRRVEFVGFVVTFFTLGGRGPVSSTVTDGGALWGDEIINT